MDICISFSFFLSIDVFYNPPVHQSLKQFIFLNFHLYDYFSIPLSSSYLNMYCIENYHICTSLTLIYICVYQIIWWVNTGRWHTKALVKYDEATITKGPWHFSTLWWLLKCFVIIKQGTNMKGWVDLIFSSWYICTYIVGE